MKPCFLARAEPTTSTSARFEHRRSVFVGLWVAALAALGALSSLSAFAAEIEGQVLGAGAPIANSTVILSSASDATPKRLGQARTGAGGRFTLTYQSPSPGGISYLVAAGGEPTAHRGGDNPAIALLSVIGRESPSKVTVNEFSTVASVWTNNQFLDGTGLKGHVLGLNIAAGNVSSFVDLQTGGWGTTVQDPLNSSQTTTMANFAPRPICSPVASPG